jgi:hypothetical protein
MSRKMTDTAKSAWYEPHYDLEKAHAANEAAEARDPAFKKMMDEARAKATAASAGSKVQE